MLKVTQHCEDTILADLEAKVERRALAFAGDPLDSVLVDRIVASLETPILVIPKVDRESIGTGDVRYTLALSEVLQGDQEDTYLAASRLEDARAGRSRTFSLDEVERDLGLEGRPPEHHLSPLGQAHGVKESSLDPSMRCSVSRS